MNKQITTLGQIFISILDQKLKKSFHEKQDKIDIALTFLLGKLHATNLKSGDNFENKHQM